MKLHLPHNIRARLKAELARAGSREIGGFLMAEQLEPGVFRIADFSVDRNVGSVAYFNREPRRHRDELEAFFAQTRRDYSRFNYLGEWHSHPSFSTRPSAMDIHAMTEILREPAIEFAVLMIVRLRTRFWLDLRCELHQRNGFRTQVAVA